VSGVGRLVLPRAHHDSFHVVVVDLARCSGPGLVDQPIETMLDQPLAPYPVA
jgi:hypothetical protein